MPALGRTLRWWRRRSTLIEADRGARTRAAAAIGVDLQDVSAANLRLG